MAKWVTRRDLNGVEIGASALCVEAQDVIRKVGVLTIDEHIAMLVADDEQVEGVSRLRPVFKNGDLVSYIEIVDASAEPVPTKL